MAQPWNKNCNECESIESEYPCVRRNCSIHSDKTKPNKGVHINCGGYFRLYENGKEKCQKCGKEDLFCNWNGKIDYLRLRYALQFIAGINDDKVDVEFFINLKNCLDKQRRDFPEKFE